MKFATLFNLPHFLLDITFKYLKIIINITTEIILNKVRAVDIRKTYTKYYRIFYLILVLFVMIYLIQIRGNMSLNLYKTTSTFLSKSINKLSNESKVMSKEQIFTYFD